MADNGSSNQSPAEQVARLYEEAEARTAKLSEEYVSGAGFGSLLARSAENAAALTKLSSDALDLVLRNLRIAGRRDIVSLARQLARTEDKLERVLQEVEALRDELTRARSAEAGPQPRPDARSAEASRQPRANARSAEAGGQPRPDGRARRSPPTPAARRKEPS